MNSAIRCPLRLINICQKAVIEKPCELNAATCFQELKAKAFCGNAIWQHKCFYCKASQLSNCDEGTLHTRFCAADVSDIKDSSLFYLKSQSSMCSYGPSVLRSQMSILVRCSEYTSVMWKFYTSSAH